MMGNAADWTSLSCAARNELDRHLYLEELRAAIRQKMLARQWSYEHTASAIGVSEHRLRELLDGRSLVASEDLVPFEAWCEGGPTGKVYPEQVALSLLFQDFGPGSRAIARQRFVWRLHSLYTRLRMPVPLWLHHELRNWQRFRPRSFVRKKWRKQ